MLNMKRNACLLALKFEFCYLICLVSEESVIITQNEETNENSNCGDSVGGRFTWRKRKYGASLIHIGLCYELLYLRKRKMKLPK